MVRRNPVRIFLLVPTLVIAYFVFQIFRPFLVPVAMAATLATLCYPAYGWIDRRLGGRDNLASLATCAAITAVIVVPFTWLGFTVAGQLRAVYGELETLVESGRLDNLSVDTLPVVGSVTAWLGQYLDLTAFDLTAAVTAALQQGGLFFLRQSPAVLSSAAGVITSFFIMLVTLFFIFRDGPALLQEVRTWTPLSSAYEEKLEETFRRVARATIIGSLLTSLAQGTAGAAVFWLVGINNAILWGSLMALFSLVPVVGTAIVWGPWVVWFALSGSYWSAIILGGLSIGVVGSIDNLLRPLLIEGGAKMHTLLVFFSIMGGISYFGLEGVIFGPIVVALGLTFLELYKIEFRDLLSKPEA